MDEERDLEEEQGERPRPRVVDKRRVGKSEGSGAPVDALSSDSPRRPAEQSSAGRLQNSPGADVAPSPPAPDASAVDSPDADTTSSAPAGTPTAGGPGEDVWTPEREAQAQQLIQEIAQTPSLDWVVQTAVSLANVAGTKLEVGQAADAQLVIDALAGLINSAGPRLQEAEQPLRQTLAQLQLAYAQRFAASE